MVTLQGIAKPAPVTTVTICCEKGLKMSRQEGNEQMNRETMLPCCRLQLYDAYTVVAVKEGVHIDFAEIEEISTALQNYYHDKPIGLIANRINRYSTNPLAVKQFFSNEHIVAGAIVGSQLTTRLNAEIEMDIIDGAPVAFFTELDQARIWVKTTVKAATESLTITPA
jgi:hypothetical protein